MKKAFVYFSLFSLTLLLGHELLAQQSTYQRQPGYWTLGFNGGLAYQSSDVPIEWRGWGVGMTLAKNLYYRPGAPLSFDLRGRFLYSQSYGLGHSPSRGLLNNTALNGQRPLGLDYTADGGGPGFVYDNHRTDMGELALEAVFHFNRLREKTKVNLSLFGGIGLDLYHTHIDQADFTGTPYYQDYLDLDPRSSTSFKRAFLRDNILDGDYETDADGFDDGPRLGFMPALGIELGYQFTPRFSMGIGHKWTFPLNDVLDGQKWDDNNLATGNNDLHHYTNLHFRWIVEADQQTLQPPLIQIIRPNRTPYNSSEAFAQVTAKISHVRSAMDVTASLNGAYTDFNFKKDYFSWSDRLQPGRNELVITATNSAGQDQKSVILIYQETIIDTPPPPPDTDLRPRVTISNPAQRNTTSNRPNFDLRAEIDHVDRKGDLSLRLNGQEIYDFDYRPNRGSGTLQAKLNLVKGRNYVQITARTSGGTAEDDAIIMYERSREEVNRPRVRITRPSNDPLRTDTRRQVIEARIEGVRNERQITFRFNGRDQNNFTFNGKILRAEVYLNPGTNDVLVEASNTAGRSSDSRQLILRDNTPPPAGPSVTFLRPNQPSSSSSQANYNIRARIRNVSRASDIRFYLNGQRQQNFSFRDEILEQRITLREGSNNVTIEASNRVGNAQESVTIRYTKVVINPVTPPQVDITQPTASSTRNGRVALEARIKHVDRKDQITLTLNGRVNDNFSYNPSSDLLQANLNLSLGNNEIVIKAVNDDGSDTDRHSIRFDSPKRPPQVTITRPSSSTSSSATVSLEAKILYVERQSDIRITLNGRSFTRFNYDARSNIVTANLSLQEGSNTIVVRGSNADGSDEDQHTIRYTRVRNPPQVVITRPTSSTSREPTIALQADIRNISSGREASLTLNGKAISSFDYNASTRLLRASLKLRAGKNTIVVKAQNADGSDQDSKVITYQPPVATPPTVSISQPTNGSTLTTNSTPVKAQIKNIKNRSNVRFFVNGREMSKFNFSGTSFSATASLRQGENLLRLTASNADGSDEDQVKVYYRPPVATPPTVSISQPTNKSTVKSSSTAVKAQVKNVKRKSDIQLFVNGKRQDNFSFSGSTLTATTNLRKGENTIRVVASNADGSDEDRATVYSQPPVVSMAKPEVVYLYPQAPGSTVAKARIRVKARIRNVERKEQITFKLNGVAVKNFEFDSSNNRLTSGVNLKKGENQLEITAQNDAGSKTARTTIKYVPGDLGGNEVEPTVRILNVSEPTLDPFEPNRGSSLIEAQTTGISSKNQVTVTVNGQAFTGFTFNPSNKRITTSISLQRGANTVVIRVKNSAGSAEVSRTIQF